MDEYDTATITATCVTTLPTFGVEISITNILKCSFASQKTQSVPITKTDTFTPYPARVIILCTRNEAHKYLLGKRRAFWMFKKVGLVVATMF